VYYRSETIYYYNSNNPAIGFSIHTLYHRPVGGLTQAFYTTNTLCHSQIIYISRYNPVWQVCHRIIIIEPQPHWKHICICNTLMIALFCFARHQHNVYITAIPYLIEWDMFWEYGVSVWTQHHHQKYSGTSNWPS